VKFTSAEPLATITDEPPVSLSPNSTSAVSGPADLAH
jgi:hypothetical protein